MKLTKPFAKYPHARTANGLVFLAGQGCRDPETNQYAGLFRDAEGRVLAYDVREQARGVFRNIDRALVSLGLGRKDLLDVTVFLVDLEKDFAAMNEVWDEYFADVSPAPVRTTIGVRCLPGDNFIEMKAIAVERGIATAT